MQPTINYSAPLKRSRTLQSGCPKNDTMPAFLPYTTYPANGTNITDSTDIINAQLSMIAPDMVPSFTRTSISSYIPDNLESIAMAQEASHMSQMSQMSHQMSPNPSQSSAHGSPSMLNQMPRPLMPYIGISASTPPMDGMAPEVFLQSRSRVERAEANGFLGSDFDYVSVSAAGPSPSSYTSMTDNITMNSDTPFATPLYEYNQVPGSSNDGASDPLDASGGDDLVQCMGGLLHSSVCTSVVQWDGFGTDPDMDMNMERTMIMGTQQQQQQQQSSSFLDPDASASPLDHSALSSHRMERNTSSHRSNQSQRLREAARRQVSNADKIAILPKQDFSQQQQQQRQSRNSTHPAVAGSVPLRETAKPPTSSQGTGKLVIAKTRRDRPKSKKLVCLYCTKHPEGFRGPHELARHYRRHHETGATRYICVDPRQRGIPTNLVLFKALEDCKNCREKKQYGVDYNAAVHLRRSHFKARQPRGKSGSDGNGAAPAPEQQADSNHFPPMDDLKDWIQEVTACPDQNATPPMGASYLQSPPADDTAAAMPAAAAAAAAAAVNYLQSSPDDDYPLQSPPDDFVSDYHVVSGMNEQYDQETNGDGGSGLNFAFDDFVPVSYPDMPDVASQSAIPRQLADADTFFSMDEDYDLTGYSQASLDIDLHMHDADMFLQPSSYDYDT